MFVKLLVLAKCEYMLLDPKADVEAEMTSNVPAVSPKFDHRI